MHGEQTEGSHTDIAFRNPTDEQVWRRHCESETRSKPDLYRTLNANQSEQHCDEAMRKQVQRNTFAHVDPTLS